MNYKEVIAFFSCLIFFQKLFCQEINGFEIFVSKAKLTSISFHSEVTNYKFDNKSTPYKIQFFGSETIVIQTDQEVDDPCILDVIEGGRKHKFIILYKEEIDYLERDHDFSDLKLLGKLVKDFEHKPDDQDATNNSYIKNATVATSDNKAGNSNFYALISDGDKAKKNQRLDEAKAKYEKALQIEPDNEYVQAQLKEVKRLIENTITVKYYNVITKANNAFSENKLEESVRYYNEALEIKSGDDYATGQIKLIQQRIESERVIKENLVKENLYKSYVSNGDKALSDKLYAAAKNSYAAALKIRPNDALLKSKLELADKKIYTDSVEQQQKKADELFISFVNVGDKSLEDRLYDAAKNAYKEALKIKPTDNAVKAKVDLIDQKIIADSIAADLKKNESLFNSFLALGDNELEDKSYDAARSAYKEALKLRPKDISVRNKLSLIDKKITADSIAAVNQQIENLFKSLVVAGDKAFAEKSYAAAKNAYDEALKLKPQGSGLAEKLNAANKKIAEEKFNTEQQKNENLFNSFLAVGDKAFDEKSYNAAANAYNAALKIKPGNEAVNTKLKMIKECVIADSLETVRIKNESLSLSFTNMGDEALEKKLYDAAKKAYIRALEVTPNNESVKKKISYVNQKMIADSLAASNNKTEKLFINFIFIGDKALNEKSYASAVNAYNAALKLKPGDETAKAKHDTAVKKIATDSLLALNEKKEKQYLSFIKAGDEALSEKLFDLAKINYNNALDIKPLDEYAQKQIQKANNAFSASDAVAEIENNMIKIKAARFKMGNNFGAGDESPLHIVEISSFYIGKYEVTQSQWHKIMGYNSAQFKSCDTCPVENISWHEAMKFIDRLNEITNKNYRLPTEAEWEFVAGTYGNKDNLDKIAWYYNNSKNKSHPVGDLKPNYLGVYDLLGNVSEWCSDWYGARFYSKKDLSNNPKGNTTGKEKVIRGGSWYDMEGALRVTGRDKKNPSDKSKQTGFRLALSAG